MSDLLDCGIGGPYSGLCRSVLGSSGGPLRACRPSLLYLDRLHRNTLVQEKTYSMTILSTPDQEMYQSKRSAAVQPCDTKSRILTTDRLSTLKSGRRNLQSNLVIDLDQ